MFETLKTLSFDTCFYLNLKHNGYLLTYSSCLLIITNDPNTSVLVLTYSLHCFLSFIYIKIVTYILLLKIKSQKLQFTHFIEIKSKEKQTRLPHFTTKSSHTTFINVHFLSYWTLLPIVILFWNGIYVFNL